MWMIVDQTGRFATLRRYPKMALISPQLDDPENPTVSALSPFIPTGQQVC
jgi:hypothetical protein